MRLDAPLKPLHLSAAAAAGVLTLDQLTKWWASEALQGAPVVLIDGFLELRYLENTGAAFSLLEGAGPLIALAALAIIGFVMVLMRRIEARPEAVALGLVMGGALGNLTDRVFGGPGLLDGGVVDFVDFSFFPAFNLADSAITIGAGLLIVLAAVRK